MTPGATPKVLVVDDDSLMCEVCRQYLEQEGVACETTQSGDSAIARIADGDFDVVLVDLVMPPPDGREVIEQARGARCQPAVIAMTAFLDEGRRLDALRAGAWAILTKPLDPVELSRTIAWALHCRAVSSSNLPREHCEALYRVATAAHSELGLTSLLNRVLGTCAATLKADFGSIMVASSPAAARRTLSVVASYGLEPTHPLTTIGFGDRICGWVAENRRPLRIVGEPSALPQFKEMTAISGIAESVIAPLESRREVLGTISLSTRTAGTFSAESLAMLVSVAELVAAAIDCERLLRRSEHHDRLAVVGQLAVSVAHELNNPLCYIRANLDDALRHLGDAATPAALEECRAPILEGLGDAREGTTRMMSLVESLRISGRKPTNEGQVVCINALLKQAERLVHPQVKHRARLTVQCGECPAVWGEANRLLQLLINLLVNASQAVESDGQIVLLSRTEQGRAVVEVSDNGPGIPPEIARRLFEPFFTTKPEGEGTGLGLSISRQIAADYGGELGFSSEGRGTTFKLTLPPAAAREGIKPTVLVVDDDENIVRAISRMLRPQFNVLGAAGAEEALRLTRNQKLDLILSDFAMPKQNGVELIRALRDQGHAAPAVLITAMAEDPAVTQALASSAESVGELRGRIG